ncbi:MAG: SH3 domain-containing protein [Clostridia bacterium]|nr:SH3 domain-containing protein [Clostridia bacterium]
MKRFFATLLAVVMLASMIPAASLAAAQYATVVGGWLRLRAGASFEADTITSYYTDTVVEILGTSGAWYRVKTPDGRNGYMHSDFLRLGGVGVPSSANAYVTSHNGYGVRLRQGPGTGYRIIRTYAVGTPVTVLERGNSWCRIKINGTEGFMMTQFLNFGSNSGNGNEIVLCYATVWSSNGYGVRLRSGPSTSNERIGKYSVGTTVAVLEKGAVWDRIRVGSRMGWMMNEFLHYQNANELTGVTLNTLNPTVGTVMKVQAMTPASATVSYTWLVGDTVKGTNSTYTVSASDVGKQIQLKLSGTGNYSGMVVSAATNAVISNTQINGLQLNTTAPVVGDVLRATISPADATVAYAWKIDGYQVGNSAEYTVAATDAGKTIELMVTGTGSYSGTLTVSTSPVTATSTITGVSIRNDSNSNAGAAPVVGDQLTAVVSPAQATVSYQWKRGGEPISGANAASYVLTEADQGAQISVTVFGVGVYSGERTAAIPEPVSERPEQPVIDELTLTDAVVGQTYAVQLTAQGGGQIVWAISSGNLPDGLTLTDTGAVTGTPTTEGSFTFAVKASNPTGQDEKTFTIKVVPAAKPELTVGNVTIPAQTVGYAQPAPVAVSITNAGNADAHLQLLYPEGGNAESFVVNENGRSVIAAGATDTTWTIQPVAGLSEGTYTTNFIVLYDNDAKASATVTFTVSAGEVIVPKAELKIEDILFAEVEEGYSQPAPVEVKITNIGDADAVLTALYPDGGNATAFKVNEDGRTTISAGAVDQSWTIQPVNGLAAGTYTTDFVVEYNGGKVIIPVTFVVKEKAPVFFQLTVENGSGSGSYEAGQSVTITANAPAEGMTFDCWTATSSSVADASSTETTFTMPEGNAVVSATYKTVE